MIPEVTCPELAAELASDTPPRLLDVREPVERDLCAIEPSEFIPLGELVDRAETLDREANWVVYCKMGGRSAAAVQHLQERGFTKVRNLTGGVRAWSAEVDPSMPVY